MKTKFIIGGLIILWLILYFSYADFSPPKDYSKEISKIEQKLDSLKTEKDSIKTVIDSTHVKIITNETRFKEVVNTIISQPTDSDYVYIKNYIRQYRSKNDSSNICRTQ